MLATKTQHATVADYLALPEGAPYQLINFELVMSPAPAPDHQYLFANVHILLWKYFSGKDLKQIRLAPFDVHLGEGEIYQPDIFIVLSGNPGTTVKNGFHGVPDVVFELLSPSNAYYDLRHKKEIYEKVGVKEYWILDPEDHTIECHRNSDKGFILSGIAKGEGIVESAVLPGFIAKTEELFANI